MRSFVPEFLREINMISIMLRIVMAIACGGIIGLERGVKGRAAGFRTHILVCMGAALAMMTGQYVYMYVSQTSDPSRLGAQVISGIGFLGVGTIITTKSLKVKGLTTAAGLWTSACLGLTIGIGFYEAALIGTLGAAIAVIFFQKIDRFFYRNSNVKDYYVEIEKVESIRSLITLLKENGYKIVAMELGQSECGREDCIGLMISIKRENKETEEEILALLGSDKNVFFIEEL